MFDFGKYGTRIACIEENGTCISYFTLQSFCNEVSGYMGSNCLAILLCKNTIGAISGYFACIQSRCVPILMGADANREQVEAVMQAYCPQYLWVPSVWYQENMSGFSNCVVFEKWDYVLLRRSVEKVKLHGDLALLLGTSGSTGNLKYVRISRTNLLSNTKAIIESLDIQEHHRAITALPLHYTYGLSVVQTHLYMGASLVLTDISILSKKFWELISLCRVTTMSGVPYTYELMRKIGFGRQSFPSLSIMTQAGGKLKEKEQMYFSSYAKEHNISFYIMYGQTEATARMCFLPAEFAATQMGSVGRAIPGGTLQICDKEGCELPSGKQGQVIYKGPNVMMGYANSYRDLCLGDMCQGSLETGDIGYKDELGFLHIVGREKRFVKICGKRINLDDVEKMLCQKQNVSLVCVNQEDKIYVLSEGMNSISERLVTEYVSRCYHIPSNCVRYREVEKIPRLPSGKVDYKVVEKCVRRTRK